MGFFENQNGSFFIVCDGMGGHAGGAVASQTAVQALRTFFNQQYYPNPQEAVYQAIQFANQEIFYKSQINAELRGMGTTCVLLLFRGGKLYYGHVGDSRIYHLRHGQLQRLTRDHSFVMALVEQGLISEAEAENHPRKNELLRAMGTDSYVEPDICTAPIVPIAGDMFMLCSDGLNSLISDEGIEDVLKSNLDVQYKAIKLIDAANAMGGFDNITVQILEFTQEAGQGSSTQNAFTYTNPLSSTKPDFLAEAQEEKKNATDFPNESEYIKPTYQTPTARKKRPDDKNDDDLVIMNNSNDGMEYRTVLFKVFGFVVGAIVLYIVYQNTLGKSKVLGSRGSWQADSVAAIEVQNQFYVYFWNSTPELQKVKKGIDETKEAIREIQEFKQKAKEALNRFFEDKRVRQIRNSLNRESLDKLAKRYNSRLDWILKANGAKSEQDLKKMDSIYIPLESPNIKVEQQSNDSLVR